MIRKRLSARKRRLRMRIKKRFQAGAKIFPDVVSSLRRSRCSLQT